MPIAIEKTVFRTEDGKEFDSLKEATIHEIVQALDESPVYISAFSREDLAKFLLANFEMTLKPVRSVPVVELHNLPEPEPELA